MQTVLHKLDQYYIGELTVIYHLESLLKMWTAYGTNDCLNRQRIVSRYSHTVKNSPEESKYGTVILDMFKHFRPSRISLCLLPNTPELSRTVPNCPRGGSIRGSRMEPTLFVFSSTASPLELKGPSNQPHYAHGISRELKEWWPNLDWSFYNRECSQSL